MSRTIRELVRDNREALVRSAFTCQAASVTLHQMIEDGSTSTPSAAATSSRQCREAALMITTLLQGAGITAEEISTLAQQIDREDAMVALLRGDG